MFYLAFVTSLAASIFLAVGLKLLNLFHFIKWNPVGYAEKWGVLEQSHGLVRWFFLLIVLFIILFILYLIMQYVALVPPFVTSLVIGGVIALLAEWIIKDLPAELSSFKKLSIPFIVTVIMTSRFVFETATYHFKAAHFEKRNKLPYKDTVIK
ncbi:hypothetical protein JOD29_000371 [Lysinibacillus composti]|uniref:Uncharacterized protein n=1 Tax=Lysinibacillus composti TaxID=720633 RepID=A0A3N9ULZ0_9BACI|nr:hypothetical protein [Lysinibacillus composti]MBM7607134.1 hypothetical protein [Lysinibacillus composti]RQW76278.1 hypothetical protein EBB45_01645 [Lysinibacillus composti]